MPEGNDPRARRVLLPAGVPSADQILKLYRWLTGREATPEERAEVERLLTEAAPRSPPETE